MRAGRFGLILFVTYGAVSWAAADGIEDPTIQTSSAVPAYPAQSYRFVVDESQSQITITATVLNKDDTDSANVRGWLDVILNPGQSPFATLHITDMDLELTDDLDFAYQWFLLGSGTAHGSGLGFSMYQAGLETPVMSDDSFVQTDNLVQGRGNFEYDMPVVGAGQMNLSEMDPLLTDLGGYVWQDGNDIILQFDIDFVYPLEVDGTELGTAWIHGTVTAKTRIYWKRADLDDNGYVDFVDFALWAPCWYQQTFNPWCDVSSPADGVIDMRDIEAFAYSWLEP